MGRRLEEHLEQTKTEVDDLPADEPSTDNAVTDRRLQQYLTCSPPRSSSDDSISDPLKVAFWEMTESASCNRITEHGVPLTTARMSEICSDFCEPASVPSSSVPFLLGTTAFGFSHEALDSVCLSPEDDNVRYSAAAVNACHEKANSFQTLQQRTAAFASALQVLDASKIRFEAEAQTAVENLKEIIRNEAPQVLDLLRRSPKIVALDGLMRDALDDVLNVNSAVKRRLQQDADTLRHSVTLLRSTLRTVVPDIQAFLNECNMLTTGVGPNKEYLLDMCSQTSSECIESSYASHVGCCCGYNPVITLGTANAAANIPTIRGIKAETIARGAPRARTGRRLQRATNIDICAEASRQSAAYIEEHRARVRELGHDDLITRQECERREKYPAFFERCGSSFSCGGSAIPRPGATESSSAPAPGANEANSAPVPGVTQSSSASAGNPELSSSSHRHRSNSYPARSTGATKLEAQMASSTIGLHLFAVKVGWVLSIFCCVCW